MYIIKNRGKKKDSLIERTLASKVMISTKLKPLLTLACDTHTSEGFEVVSFALLESKGSILFR